MKQTRIIAKAILRRPDGCVLILRRSKTDVRRPLQWDLPGGMCEQGEDVVASAVRETREESGLVVNKNNMSLAYAMSDMTERGNVCWLYFIGEIDAQEVEISYEHDRFLWAKPGQAAEMVTYEPQQKACITYLITHYLIKHLSAVASHKFTPYNTLQNMLTLTQG